MISSRIRRGAAVLALTAGVAFAVPATANAAIPSRADSPDVNNFLTYTAAGETGLSAAYPCLAGTDYAATQDPVLSVRNNCEYRVYLQYADGHSDCVNPNTTRDIVDSNNWYPTGLLIGSRAISC